jgi:hypothetical protein
MAKTWGEGMQVLPSPLEILVQRGKREIFYVLRAILQLTSSF